MPDNDQQTSAPYSADVLQSRDTGLLLALEFGTEVTSNVGTAFNYGVGSPGENYLASIDARLGMLSLEHTDPATPPDAPEGQSYSLPPVSQWTPLDIGAPNRACVVYVHQLLRTNTEFQAAGPVSDDTRAGFLLGRDAALTGTVAAADRDAADYTLRAPRWAAGTVEPIGWEVFDWQDGVRSVSNIGPIVQSGSTYWRVYCWSDGGGSIQTAASRSADGVSWQDAARVDIVEVSEDFRIGAYVESAYAKSLLDWVRVYAADPTDNPTSPASINYPETGGRLFL